MSHGTRHKGPCAQEPGFFIWPLGQSPDTPDEMNTSFGPRIDADRWDFHDGIDLPAPVGTPVHAMTDGMVHRAGPADEVFGSTHVRLKVVDPTDGQDNLFLVYLHLDSIAEGVIPGAPVCRGDVIGAVGQEDATYPHLHFEFRKGGPEQVHSVHPLRYLGYPNQANFTQLRLDRCNFYRRDDGDKRMVRLRFDVANRREGDVQGVDVELTGEDVERRKLHVDFDDRNTIVSDKGDQHAFNEQGIAVEGYQKSNLKGERLKDLHYDVLVKDITPKYQFATLDVLDVKKGKTKSPKLALPQPIHQRPVNSRAGFEERETFPPPGWDLSVLSGNICRPDPAAVLTGSRGLLCRDLQSEGALIRAGLRFALPVAGSAVRPMSWRLRADMRLAALQMDWGLMMHPLAFLAGNEVVAAACLRKIISGELVAGVMIRSTDGLFRERIDVEDGKISTDGPAKWEVELSRVGTRQTTAILRLANKEIVRLDGDTTNVEPDGAFVGILHRHDGLQITLHIDQVLLTEAPR
ncbi:MAG TPA: M23 family metallopeptidase [Nitrospiraceae bacterium]|nr:M23 family metallopeptidase [Nitrospiraceae bacterium]